MLQEHPSGGHGTCTTRSSIVLIQILTVKPSNNSIVFYVFFRFSPQSMKFDQIASDKIWGWGKLSFKEIK